MKTFINIFLGLLLVNFSFSQSLDSHEEELYTYLESLRAAETDQEKVQANDLFKAKLEQVIQMEGAFDYPFSKLRTLGSIKSPDNLIRLFNWNVEQEDQTQKYYCYVLSYEPRQKKYKVIELIDNSVMLPMRPTDVLDQDNWYGALYYKIIPVQKGSRTLYTVLGWDGNSSMSNVKVIDVLSITGSTVRIGNPIFKIGKETSRRVFFEYAKKTTMFLNFEEQYNRIIFDHLAPETPELTGMYSMYLPDLSHDAFTLKDGKWIFVEDVVGVNKASEETITIQVKDDKTGEIKEQKIKNKWEAPSESHVATTPEDQMKEKDEGKKTEVSKSKENSRKAPQSYNPVSGKKKKKR